MRDPRFTRPLTHWLTLGFVGLLAVGLAIEAGRVLLEMLAAAARWIAG